MKSSNVKILNGSGGSYEAPLAKVVEIQPDGGIGDCRHQNT